MGPELLLRLDRDLPEPLGSQLERGLREAVQSRRLAVNERLPSSRALARELGVSRGLVQGCYSQLNAEGLLSTRAGSGTRVAAGAQQAPAPGMAAAAGARLAIDFRPGEPDLASFPREDWVWAIRQVSRTAPAEVLGSGDPRGSPRLREVLAAYLGRARGAVADPERIVVCTGVAQGLKLLMRALDRDDARPVALEDPGGIDPHTSDQLWGKRAIAVAVDGDGIDVEALATSDADAVVLTPAHQWPTGVALAPERRQALVEWAADRDGMIIEDDYDSEFRYDRERVGALQGLVPERVALLGTISQSLAPVLRLGWIVCPPRVLEAVTEAKERDDRGSPEVDQLALATLIESGRFDQHLRQMRPIYSGKRWALIAALARHAPEVELRGLTAGFHAIGRLPDRLDEQAVVLAARERSIGLYPMSRYRWSNVPHRPELVFGFGNLSEAAIERGIETIADLLGGR